jgi:hexosaminidase
VVIIFDMSAIRALETVSQLVYRVDDTFEIRDCPLQIFDFPRFSHRGLLIDTSRNFLSVGSILRTLEAMAHSKMNVLHWHIVDSESFPLEILSYPQLTKGAYSQYQTYSQSDVRDIVSFAHFRGIRVIVEFDMPVRIFLGILTYLGTRPLLGGKHSRSDSLR